MRIYEFYTVWESRDALDGWMTNEFHRSVLMVNFRKWMVQSVFDYWTLADDNARARKCPACGRWTQEKPGWSAVHPSTCRQGGGALMAQSE